LARQCWSAMVRSVMAQTIVIRVSDRTLLALQRGETVPIRLTRKNVVGGVTRRTGRRPGRKARAKRLWWQVGDLPAPGSLPARLLLWAIAQGGKVTTKQAQGVFRRSSTQASGMLSHLAAAGLLRRDGWGRYVVTSRGKASRKALSKVGPYREGSNRARVLAWARKRRRPFGIEDVARLLGVGRASVHVVLQRLLKDRFIARERIGAYRAR